MLPIINGYWKKYKLEKLVVIAGSGLLSKTQIKQLWLIEKAFRIAKTGLKIRPVITINNEQ